MKFNISKPKKYFKDNQEKTMWQNVGVLTEFHKQDGSVSRLLEIPAIGLEAQVFPFKEDEKREKPAPKQSAEEEYNAYGGKEIQEEINPDDIPY